MHLSLLAFERYYRFSSSKAQRLGKETTQKISRIGGTVWMGD
jgi:hypothetical protein